MLCPLSYEGLGCTFAQRGRAYRAACSPSTVLRFAVQLKPRLDFVLQVAVQYGRGEGAGTSDQANRRREAGVPGGREPSRHSDVVLGKGAVAARGDPRPRKCRPEDPVRGARLVE